METIPVPGLPCATIHEAKGQDFEVVCLVLEKESEGAVVAWEARASDSSEALRVIYVGATRAKKLLAIALPTCLRERVEAILSISNVHYQIEMPDITPGSSVVGQFEIRASVAPLANA